MPAVKGTEIPFAANPKPLIQNRIFRERGEQAYSLELLPAGITFEVTRLARRSKELWGELRVTVNGSTPYARTIGDGVLSVGDLNFSSVNARESRAKLLSSRSQAEMLDWHGFLEEFAVRIIDVDRRGKPAVILSDLPLAQDDAGLWEVEGLPILKTLPMVLFGAGGAAKSYLSMWIAGVLASRNVPILYADWEFAAQDHRKRLELLFQPMPKALWYVTCDRPMADEVDRLARLVIEHQIQYIVCDSMVFALNGPADDEHAGIYFRALRSLKVGSLNVAHTTKADDDKEKQVYGSVFFQNGARSIWFAQRADSNPIGELQIGLYHRKSNVSGLYQPLGFKLLFRSGVTKIERIHVNDVDELADKLPLLDRMKRALRSKALPLKALADDIGVQPNAIRSMVSRHKTVFMRVADGKIALCADAMDF